MDAALFAYGTLEAAEVWLAVAGRACAAEPARLPGWACFRVRGADYPGVLPRAGAATLGTLYRGVDAGMLARLDSYEGALYRRERLRVVTLAGAATLAWVYVVRPEHADRLGDEAWQRVHAPAGKE